MGGGPANADVVRASCLLTFPEESMAEPVPVDAWYLHAAGRTFLRRLARDRLGDDAKISLLMQRSGESEHIKRYVSVGTDDVLKEALQETFDHPDRVLVLHIIFLHKVRDLKTIHVRPEINPNVSPEPVAPMEVVFPTLSVDGLLDMSGSVPTMASSYRMNQSMYEFGKESKQFGLEKSQALAHTTSFIEERDYTRRQTSFSGKADSTDFSQELSSKQNSVQVQEEQNVDDAAMNYLTLPTAKQLDDDSTIDGDIPIARVVGQAEVSDMTQLTNDYVVLELQHGAGLTDAAAITDSDTNALAASSSTYFLSSTWHLQAEEMSASMRLSSTERSEARQVRELEQVVQGNGNLEESFVMLDRHHS